MQTVASFLGVDLGASSGRVIAGHWDGSRFQLEELHRFVNAGVSVADRTYWDVLNIWAQILRGFSRFGALYSACPAAIGIDAWGIDFGLLDKRGRLILQPRTLQGSQDRRCPRASFRSPGQEVDLLRDGCAALAHQHPVSALQYGARR